MSRIGKMPIPIPKGVTISVQDNVMTVKGPKGTLTRSLPAEMIIKVEPELVTVERPSESKTHRSLHGLTRTLIANMVLGVTDGFEKVLEMRGVGYRAELQGRKLNIQVGYSHPVEVEPLQEDISFEVKQLAEADPTTSSRPTVIWVRGIDKEAVGQQAAKIRAIRKPEPYKGKGIRYRGEYIRLKDGKSAKAGGKK